MIARCAMVVYRRVVYIRRLICQIEIFDNFVATLIVLGAFAILSEYNVDNISLFEKGWVRIRMVCRNIVTVNNIDSKKGQDHWHIIWHRIFESFPCLTHHKLFSLV